MSNIFLKAERFYLRYITYITQKDFKELQAILQDNYVMYAWKYDFGNEDVQDWIDKTLECYKRYNLDFFND